MNRIGSDDVELFIGGEYEVSSVVINDLDGHPGANVIVASNPLLSYIVSSALSRAGLERRGEIRHA